MAQESLLLGIGGTGSRIIESCLALLTAGLGPRDGVHIGLVDQDGENGNAGRTNLLFKAIGRLQGAIGPGAGGFPGVSITSFREALFHWNEQINIGWKPDVEDRRLADLMNVGNDTDEKKALFAHLYEEQEADEPLKIGFKGHANVGATATYAALMDPAGELNQRLLYFVQQAALNEDVRFFLAGSIFGGMGASGFPTIARRLRKLQKENGDPTIRIGGVLMLPYFTFSDDDEDEFALKSREVLQNSRHALEFYAKLLDSEPDIFDRFYLAGWNDFFELDYCRTGGPAQKNPPMPPELYAAAAALDFLTGPIEPALPVNPRNRTLPIKITGRHDEDAMAWGDMTDRQQILPALGRLLRLAAYWRYSIDPALCAGLPIAAEWQHLIGPVDREFLDLLVQQTKDDSNGNGVFDLLLRWAGAMDFFSQTDSALGFDLWNAECVSGDLARPEEGVSLTPQDLAIGSLFNGLIATAQRDACDLYAEINRLGSKVRAGTQAGAGSFLRCVDTAARLAD